VNSALGCLAKSRPARHIQEAGRRVRVADCDPASWAELTALRLPTCVWIWSPEV
jgi:hypothetical protein